MVNFCQQVLQTLESNMQVFSASNSVYRSGGGLYDNLSVASYFALSFL